MRYIYLVQVEGGINNGLGFIFTNTLISVDDKIFYKVCLFGKTSSGNPIYFRNLEDKDFVIVRQMELDHFLRNLFHVSVM